jgi:thiol-disulfide isomerase/thioredoxin
MAFKHFLMITLLVFFMPSQQGNAVEQNKQNYFQSGSYQQILDKHTNRPFMLAVWSVSCSSCLKEMEQLSAIHKKFPDLEIIMLSVNDFSEQATVNNILQKHEITDLESWIFADPDSQRLRFEIDPEWYGELPRTYFFNSTHDRKGISGTQTNEQLISWVSEIIKKDH